MPHELQQRWLLRNQRGLELEKEGKTSDAIGVYESNLTEGCDATLTFSRLARLYRARGDVDNEARVLEAALMLVGSTAGRFAAVERRLDEIRGRRRRRKHVATFAAAAAVVVVILLLSLLLAA